MGWVVACGACCGVSTRGVVHADLSSAARHLDDPKVRMVYKLMSRHPTMFPLRRHHIVPLGRQASERVGRCPQSWPSARLGKETQDTNNLCQSGRWSKLIVVVALDYASLTIITVTTAWLNQPTRRATPQRRLWGRILYTFSNGTSRSLLGAVEGENGVSSFCVSFLFFVKLLVLACDSTRMNATEQTIRLVGNLKASSLFN